MRNLKRALSLLLSSTMVLGMVVMGGSAAGYQDVDASNDNQEAIEVMQAVGIMSGVDDKGNFNPDGSLTRNEMAVVMAHLLNLDYDYYRGVNTFTDVPEWAAPYVAACVAEGVTAGIGNGLYGGDQKITAAQASLMVMKALGYFQYQEDFGDDWQIATIRQASYIDMFDNINANAESALTRGQVAQLVLNGLKAKMVDFTGDVGTTATIGDATIHIGYRAEYTPKASAASKYNTIDDGTTNINADDQYYVQLGEELYNGNLSLKASTDDFARPANTWRYDGSDIGTYTKDADLTYTSSVKSDKIYTDLGLSKTIAKDKVTVFVNGVEDEDLAVSIRKGGSEKVANSNNGVLTQVYYDTEKETILVTRIDTYVGTVVKTVDATDSANAYVVINPETPNPGIGNENFETNKTFEDGTYVLYTYSESAEEIKSVELAQEVNGVVSRAENNDQNNYDKKALTIDGTRYTASAQIAGENLGDVSVNEQYTVYLDSYGYLIYVERIDEIGDYALMYQVNGGTLFNSHKAYLVFADGTNAVVNTSKNYLDVENLNYDYDGNGTVTPGDSTPGTDQYQWKQAGYTPVIVTYRVEENGDYTLRAVSSKQTATTWNVTEVAQNDTDFTLVNDKAGITGLGSVKTANSATTFVVREPASRSNDLIDDWTSYTGIKNAPSIQVLDLESLPTVAPADEASEKADIYYYCKSGSMVTIMFIVPDSEVVVEDGNNKALFLSDDSVSNLIHDSLGDYYEYQAVTNDKIDTVKVSADVTVDGVKVGEAAAKTLGDQIYSRYSTDKNGIITRLTTFTGSNYVTGDESGYAHYTGIDKVSEAYTVILDPKGANVTITVAEDADIYYVKDGKVTTSSYNGIAIDDDDKVFAVVDDYMVQTLVIVEVDTKNNAQPAGVAISGEKNVVVGDALTLTATVTPADLKNDTIIGYQWYRYTTGSLSTVAAVESTATKITGATGATLTVDTSAAGTYYYYCVVETYNDKVTGKDTAKGFDVSAPVSISADKSDYAGTLTVDMDYSKSGLDKTTNVWNVNGISYNGAVPTYRQIAAKIVSTVCSDQQLTYSTVGISGSVYTYEFSDGINTYYVKYDSSSAATEQTLTNPTAAQINTALNNNSDVIVNGDVTLDNTLDSKLAASKSLTINGNVALTGTVTPSGGDLAINGNITAASAATLDAQAATVNFDGDVTIGENVTMKVDTFTATGEITVADGATFDDYSGAKFPAGTGSIVYEGTAVGKLNGSAYINGGGYITLGTDGKITIKNSYLELTAGTATVGALPAINAGEQVVVKSGATLAFGSGVTLTGGSGTTFVFEKGAQIGTTNFPATSFYSDAGSTAYTAATLQAAIDAGNVSFTWNAGSSNWQPTV